jgi:electron transfer flavoprotein alpha subunit
MIVCRIAEEITYIMKDLIGKGGYKNIVGLSSSLGKDVIPRISGYFSSQPISDITEVIVFLYIFRVKILM